MDVNLEFEHRSLVAVNDRYSSAFTNDGIRHNRFYRRRLNLDHHGFNGIDVVIVATPNSLLLNSLLNTCKQYSWIHVHSIRGSM